MNNLYKDDIDDIALSLINDLRKEYGYTDESIVIGFAIDGVDYYASMQKNGILSDLLIVKFKEKGISPTLQKSIDCYDRISAAIKEKALSILVEEFNHEDLVIKIRANYSSNMPYEELLIEIKNDIVGFEKSLVIEIVSLLDNVDVSFGTLTKDLDLAMQQCNMDSCMDIIDGAKQNYSNLCIYLGDIMEKIKNRIEYTNTIQEKMKGECNGNTT
jgi:hypothetical protein